MLVGERMTKEPVTIVEDTSIDKALKLMHDRSIRRLPVLDKHGKLVGIVSEKDLLYVSPSPATSLSVWEIPHLLSKIKMRDTMTKDVITVTEDVPLEEAARIMADSKVGGLPVMRDGDLVGIITETDMFKVFLEMLGAHEDTVRLTVLVPGEKGTLAKVTGKIAELGGNIMALGTMMSVDLVNYELMLRVADVPEEELISAVQGLDMKVLDARFCTTPDCSE